MSKKRTDAESVTTQAKKQKQEVIVPEEPSLLSEQLHEASAENKPKLWSGIFKVSANFYENGGDVLEDVYSYLNDAQGDEFHPGQVSTVFEWLSREILDGKIVLPPNIVQELLDGYH